MFRYHLPSFLDLPSPLLLIREWMNSWGLCIMSSQVWCWLLLSLTLSSPLPLLIDDQNSPEWIENSEADTFFCFSLMMGEIRVRRLLISFPIPHSFSFDQDMYIHNMDEASTGISGRIQKFVDTLRWYDEELCDHLLQQVQYDFLPGPHTY